MVLMGFHHTNNGLDSFSIVLLHVHYSHSFSEAVLEYSR